jgi:nucleotide-binding universal stress UspA family protein
MSEFTIYGKPSSSLEYLKMILRKNLDAAGLQMKFNLVSDMDTIIEEHIQSIPAVKIKDKYYFKENGNLNSFIHTVSHQLLKENNFGTMQKIIVPFDFSEASEHALDYAIQLSKQMKATVKLIHAFHPTAANVEGVYAVDPHLREQRENELKAYISKLNNQFLAGSSNGPFFDYEITDGFAIDQIVMESEPGEGKFIVMGTTGEGGSFKKYIGSVSISVAKNSKCPVILVPPNSAINDFSKIVYLSNNLSMDTAAIMVLAKFNDLFNSQIHVVHAKLKDDQYCTDSAKMLWSSFIPNQDLTFTTIKSDNLAESVNNYCGLHDIELISMGTKHRSFFEKLFHKSTVKEMARYAKLPLLITHTE